MPDARMLWRHGLNGREAPVPATVAAPDRGRGELARGGSKRRGHQAGQNSEVQAHRQPRSRSEWTREGSSGYAGSGSGPQPRPRWRAHLSNPGLRCHLPAQGGDRGGAGRGEQDGDGKGGPWKAREKRDMHDVRGRLGKIPSEARARDPALVCWKLSCGPWNLFQTEAHPCSAISGLPPSPLAASPSDLRLFQIRSIF